MDLTILFCIFVIIVMLGRGYCHFLLPFSFIDKAREHTVLWHFLQTITDKLL